MYRWLVMLMLMMGAGCGQRSWPEGDLVVFVPGAGGDGPWYAGVRQGLDGSEEVVTFSWGMPTPFYFMNLQSRSIHDSAEEKLCRMIEEHAGGVVLMGHSAGCGVVLGAMEKLKEGLMVERVVLLAPSVSPEYELGPALARLRGDMHVFVSERDRLWLSWRTSTFGTYDDVKTVAAGNRGFSFKELTEAERMKIKQYVYEAEWAEMGNDGDHYGAVSAAFVREKVAPLIGGAAMARGR